MAYPELVSRGVSKSHTFEGLVKVGASKGVIRVDLKKSWPGGFRCCSANLHSCSHPVLHIILPRMLTVINQNFAAACV